MERAGFGTGCEGEQERDGGFVGFGAGLGTEEEWAHKASDCDTMQQPVNQGEDSIKQFVFGALGRLETVGFNKQLLSPRKYTSSITVIC